jgi:hypothetical protein
MGMCEVFDTYIGDFPQNVFLESIAIPTPTNNPSGRKKSQCNEIMKQSRKDILRMHAASTFPVLIQVVEKMRKVLHEKEQQCIEAASPKTKIPKRGSQSNQESDLQENCRPHRVESTPPRRS